MWRPMVWKKAQRKTKETEERKKDRQKISFSSTSVLYVFHNNCSLNSSERSRLRWSHRVPPSPTAATKPSRGLSCFNTNNPIYSSLATLLHTVTHTPPPYITQVCVHFDFCCYICVRCTHACESACVWESFRLEHIERERSTDTSLFLNKAKVEWKERSCSSIIRSPCCGG